MDRELKFFEALREAVDICMEKDPSVYIIGLGVPDPKGVFGSTLDLHKKFGNSRAMDMPASENGMTGIAIGSALVGMRPILTHQRVDFALLSLEQIANQAANWHYMFGGKMSVPLVIRLIVGRGWGQGPQHSQSFHSWFAHVPGLKVVMPTTPSDAKGLLISSIEDNNPVIFIEHRWLYNIQGEVPKGHYQVPIGKAKVSKNGKDVTIVSFSYMTLEALRAAEMLEMDGVSVEVIDLRTIKPIDYDTIFQSVIKTGKLVVADIGWYTGGIGGEIISKVSEEMFSSLLAPPCRVALPDCPTPTSRELAKHYYPRAIHIAAAIRKMLGCPMPDEEEKKSSIPLDVPDSSFKGPF